MMPAGYGEAGRWTRGHESRITEVHESRITVSRGA